MNGIFIGICITFTADSITIFIGIATYGKLEPIAPREIIDNVHAEKVLKHNNMELKAISDEWENVLSSERETMSQKVLSTQDELNKAVISLVKKQMDICGKIEDLIINTYEDFEKYKKENDDPTAIDNYLIFISNCYQLIRDFTLTLVFGDAVIENRYSLSDKADRISKELEKKYGKSDLGVKILRRRDKSEEILANRQKIADCQEKIIEAKADLEKGLAETEELKLVVDKEKTLRSVIPDEINTMISDLESNNRKLIKALEDRKIQLQKKKDAILEESLQMGLFKRNKKKNLEKLSEDYDVLMQNTEKRIHNIEEELKNLQSIKSDLLLKLENTVVESRARYEGANRLFEESSSTTERYKLMIIEAEEREKTLYKEYEEIIENWPSMSF